MTHILSPKILVNMYKHNPSINHLSPFGCENVQTFLLKNFFSCILWKYVLSLRCTFPESVKNSQTVVLGCDIYVSCRAPCHYHGNPPKEQDY